MTEKSLTEFLAEEEERISRRSSGSPEAGLEAKKFAEIELLRDLKPKDVAVLLNIHVNTVKRWLSNGWFDGAYRLGTRGDWRIPRRSLENVKNHSRIW